MLEEAINVICAVFRFTDILVEESSKKSLELVLIVRELLPNEPILSLNVIILPGFVKAGGRVKVPGLTDVSAKNRPVFESIDISI